MAIRILIAEDNSRLARTLIDKLNLFEDQLSVRGWESHGKALLKHLEVDAHVDLILMDIQMPVLDGIETTRIVKQKYPQIKVIMSTVFDEENYILEAIMAGANGYLLKDERPDKLMDAINEVMDGGAPMSSSVARKALNLIRYGAKEEAVVEVDFKLTKRETEILEQLATGLNYNQIAENLFISPGTVRKHIENIYQKLQVHNKVEAVQLAIKNRLI
ncbi:response regulator [Owenweeksia hongkongensis]|uniref:response regulator n=1 Tax=Owenweeksia hongkongensis TaxID=253245 RepID=UPI003A8D7ACD